MIVPPDRKLDLTGFPVDPGERVEVILLHHQDTGPVRTRESFRGSVLKFERPFDPMCEEDEFDALRNPGSVIDPNGNE